jgi:enterochelin esterase family protein
MSRPRRILVALALAWLAGAPLSAEIRHESFRAPSLGRDVPYLVDLPEGYGGGTRYPVLYVLHGLFEEYDFWERRGLAPVLAELRAGGAVPDFVVVSVDGHSSFFANSALGRYEDLVVEDLVAHVEASLDVIPEPAARAIAGVSMGGYAALRIAFKHPERFAAVATHSAMLLRQIPSAAAGARRGQMRAFSQVFGDPIDPEAWRAADPLAWARRAGDETPPLYFDCGAQDRYGLAGGHQALHEILEERGVAHEFALYPGDHGYAYVRGVLARSLRFVGRHLRAPR